MARIYYALVKKNIKTIEEVPESIRAEVEAMLGASE